MIRQLEEFLKSGSCLLGLGENHEFTEAVNFSVCHDLL